MSNEALITAIGGWMVEQAFGEPEIADLFGQMCDRVLAAGIPIGRVIANWTTLHPLFRVESVLWHKGQSVEFEQFPFFTDDGVPEAWINSPLKFLVDTKTEMMRRPLEGVEAVLDYPILEEFAEEGYSDYLGFATELSLPGQQPDSAEEDTGGILMSFTCTRSGGFSKQDIEGLRRIHRRFALVSKTIIQSRICKTITETYLGKLAGQKVLSGQIHRGDGETIPAIVLYADMRNSTQLTEGMEREAYIELLNAYFECISTPVIDMGGDILDFIGDAVVGLFAIDDKIPLDKAVAQATHAVALARKRLVDLNAKFMSAGQEPIDFGIGLSNGDVMFGNVGVPDRLTFSIIGSTVNRVARIESLTKTVGRPVIATQGIAEARPHAWESIGKHDLNGFEEGVALYALRDDGLTK